MIQFKGNSNTNKSSRRGKVPMIIVNHITGSTALSAHNWFTSKSNDVSSAHFLVTKQGEIWQYVDIGLNAWANGLSFKTMNRATSPFLEKHWKENGFINPNWISVSIEHEALKGESLTGAQYSATRWLHNYIITEVKSKYGYDFMIDREHIIGHKEIDRINKPFCPMDNFPYDELIADLKRMRGESVMGWEQSTGMAAVDSLYKKGIITDAELWKSEDMKGATPLWLTFLLVDKLSGDEPQKEESQKKRYVKVDTSVLNVRHAPKGKIVSQVYQRDVLEVLDEQDGWFRIKNEKVTGWVSGDYVVALGSF